MKHKKDKILYVLLGFFGLLMVFSYVLLQDQNSIFDLSALFTSVDGIEMQSQVPETQVRQLQFEDIPLAGLSSTEGTFDIPWNEIYEHLETEYSLDRQEIIGGNFEVSEFSIDQNEDGVFANLTLISGAAEQSEIVTPQQ